MAKIDRQIEEIHDRLDVILYSKDILSAHVHLTTSGDEKRRLVQRLAELENSILKIREICDEISPRKEKNPKWW